MASRAGDVLSHQPCRAVDAAIWWPPLLSSSLPLGPLLPRLLPQLRGAHQLLSRQHVQHDIVTAKAKSRLSEKMRKQQSLGPVSLKSWGLALGHTPEDCTHFPGGTFEARGRW